MEIRVTGSGRLQRPDRLAGISEASNSIGGIGAVTLIQLMYRKKSTLSSRNRVEMKTFVMRKFSVSLSVSAMIVKQDKNFTMAKIFKKVCIPLFVTLTVTILLQLDNF